MEDTLSYYDDVDPVKQAYLDELRERAHVEAVRLTTIQMRHRGMPKTSVRTKRDGLGHRPPKSGVDNAGTRWQGTSRILDVAGRRRRNRLTWAQMKAASRRAYVASR